MVGASIAALIVIALLYFAVTWVVRNYNQPPVPPAQYIEPTNTVTRISTTTTTPTITSTVPPQTSEIDNPTPDSSTSGSSDTSATDTSSSPTTPTTTTSVSITQSRHSHYGPDPNWQRPGVRTVSPPR